MTKRLEPCGHWRGRESALRRRRCYCRLGGAKSNRLTTCRVERLSRIVSLGCLVSTWNFDIWCDSNFGLLAFVSPQLWLKKTDCVCVFLTWEKKNIVTQLDKVVHKFIVCKGVSKKAKVKQKGKPCWMKLRSPTDIVILNASFPPPSTCSCAAILRKLRPPVRTLLDCWGKLKNFWRADVGTAYYVRASRVTEPEQSHGDVHSSALLRCTKGISKGRWAERQTSLLALWKYVWLYFCCPHFGLGKKKFWLQQEIIVFPLSFPIFLSIWSATCM